VDPTKEEKLTYVRVAGSDDNIFLKPPGRISLEAALEHTEDELIEAKPVSIGLQKILVKESSCRRNRRHA